MNVRAPELAVELLAYPLRRTPCPACSRPQPRLAGAPPEPPHCPRCNGAGYVFRPPAPALSLVHDTDPEA